MAWGLPTFARIAAARWSCRSSMNPNAAIRRAIAELLIDAGEELVAPGHRRDGCRHRPACAHPLRWDGHDARRSARRDQRDARRVRDGAPRPLRLHLSRQTAGGGGSGGGGARRGCGTQGAGPAAQRRNRGTGGEHALLFRRRLARSGNFSPRAPRARPARRGPGAHHRAASDDRCGARLVRRSNGEEPHRAPPHDAARRRPTRSARMPTR